MSYRSLNQCHCAYSIYSFIVFIYYYVATKDNKNKKAQHKTEKNETYIKLKLNNFIRKVNEVVLEITKSFGFNKYMSVA